jgi:AcrR family transcriptional regulator
MTTGAAPRRLPARERRTALLDAAREVFARSGLAGATLKDIGTAAGVDPSIVYRHFENKEAIFEEAIASPLETAVARWQEIARSTATYAEGGELDRDLVAVEVGKLVTAVAEASPLIAVMLFSERGQEFFTDHFEPALRTFAEALELAKPHWAHIDFDPRVVADAILGASLIAGIQANFGSTELDTEKLGRQLNDLVLDGIRPR